MKAKELRAAIADLDDEAELTIVQGPPSFIIKVVKDDENE